MVQRIPFVLLLAVSLLTGCGPSPESGRVAALEGSPPVFRSVLDGRPRMITFHLDDSLWVAYSAETGGFYRASRDGVDLDGAVSTSMHGPQPESIGQAYVVSDSAGGWHLIRDGRRQSPEVRYCGHAFEDDGAALVIELRNSDGDGSWITVRKLPRRVRGDNGHVGLERTFVTENVPQGTQVALDIRWPRLPITRVIQPMGGWTSGPEMVMRN